MTCRYGFIADFTNLIPFVLFFPGCWSIRLVTYLFTIYNIFQAACTPDQINTLLQATGNTEVEAFYPIIFSNYLGEPEKLAQYIAFPSSGGGGGGGGGAAAADAGGAAAEEAKPEEKEEEVEMDLGGGMDMFGEADGGGGGGGDY